MEHPIRKSIERTGPGGSFGIRPGDVVADVERRRVSAALPAPATGAKGKIIAVDIHADFVESVREKIIRNGWKNVHAVLGTEKDPALPQG